MKGPTVETSCVNHALLRYAARPARVRLPPAQVRPQAALPGGLSTHGMPRSPTEYPGGTSLGTFADASIAAGTLRPFIGVMPAAGTSPRYNGEWAGEWALPTIAARAGRVIAGLSSASCDASVSARPTVRT